MGEDFFQYNMIQWDTFQPGVEEHAELRYFGVVQYNPRPYINKQAIKPEIIEL